jgi:hypothetical protein
MAIKSASPKGTSFGIQPSNQQNVPAAGESNIQGSSKGNLTKGDEVGIGTDSTNLLLNADLEAALAVRGLSTLRPELIGSFEFIPPLSSPYGNPDEVTSTSSGELFDLQAQLKNLRYTETLEFLKQELGIRPSRRGADRQTGLTSNSSNSRKFLEEYKREMRGAKDIVDWLTTTYNAITIMLHAMDFKNTLTEGDLESAGGIKNANQFSGKYIDVYHQQYTLQEFLRQRCHIPNAWWESTNTTTLMCQLAVMIVGFLSRPSPPDDRGRTPDKNIIYDGSAAGAVDSDDSTPDSKKFDKGQILGAYTRNSNGVGISNVTTSALESFAKISWANAGGTPFISNATAGAYSNYFTEGDFYFMQNLIEMEAGDGVSHATGSWLGSLLKYIARDAMATVALQSGAYEDAGITSEQQKVDLDKKFKKVLGIAFRVNRKLGAINPQGIQNSVIGRICPKNKDDGRGKVETFTIASSDLDNDDVQPARTGKSYFADEIVTSEISDTTKRLQELADDMTQAKQKLKALLDNTLNKKKVRDSSGYHKLEEWWQKPPGHGDAADYLNAADLAWYVGAACAADYDMTKLYLINRESHVIPHLIAAACATSAELSWHLFKFMVTSYAHTDNKASDAELDTAIERVADNLLEKYGGLTGEDNPSGNSQSSHSTGGRSEYAFGAGYLGDWRSLTPPGQCPGSHIECELVDEYSLTYEEIYEALALQTNINGSSGWTHSGGVFTGPRRAVNHFLNRVYESYEKPEFLAHGGNSLAPFMKGTGTHGIYVEGMYAVAALWAICNFTLFSAVIVPGESEWSGGPYPV